MVDLAARTERRLDAYLDERGLEAVWFAKPNGFAWLTGGDNVVDADADFGVGAAGYDGDPGDHRRHRGGPPRRRAPRRRRRRVVPVARETRWLRRSLRALSRASGRRLRRTGGFERVDGSRLRQPLTDDDVERYRELGREAAAAVETVCRNLEPEDPEYEVAAGIDISLASRDVDTPVVLVGGAERAQRYRHYTPSDATLGDYALVSVAAGPASTPRSPEPSRSTPPTG